MAISKNASLFLGAMTLLACASQPGPSRTPELSLVLRDDDHQVKTLRQLTQHHRATVLVAWSPGCPCVRRYQARVDALLGAYPHERVQVVAMASNAGEDPAEVLRVARERGVRVPITFDEGGQVANALGLRSTPEVAVLDETGRLRFLGWIDNEREPGEPGREPYLELALAGVLADRHDFSARSPVYGCPITRELVSGSTHWCCSGAKHNKETP